MGVPGDQVAIYILAKDILTTNGILMVEAHATAAECLCGLDGAVHKFKEAGKLPS